MAPAWAIPVQVSTDSGGSHPVVRIAGQADEPAVMPVNRPGEINRGTNTKPGTTKDFPQLLIILPCLSITIKAG
jgi:hypothetical protein